MVTWHPAELRARLERVIASQSLEGLELEYWSASGSAPPARLSEQLRLLVVDGRDTIEFTRTRPAPNELPLPLDRYRLPAPGEDVASLAQRMLAVFESTIETPAPRRDAEVTRISLHEGSRSESRVWYARALPGFAPVREEVVRLATLAMDHGTHDVVRFTPVGEEASAP